MFQFSAPNKGDCNQSNANQMDEAMSVSILSPQQRGLQLDIQRAKDWMKASFNSQPPTKGTAIAG